MLLEASGVSKRFGRNAVLEDVSFGVVRGEILGLIGPNGSGKTTLFECLAGLLPADRGEVRFNGEVLGASQRKRALFYLPDAIRPWADQRLRWVLQFFAALHSRPEGRALHLAEQLQLRELLASRLGSLSKGELKRALLALGLLTPHPILLLDEPFDGLDFRQAREVMTLLQTVQHGGRTLFLSIHQLGDAAKICDRFVLLSVGKAAGEGTLMELNAKAGLSEGGLEEVFLALT